MRWSAACVTLLCGCGGNLATDAEPCAADERVFEKRWLVGDDPIESDDDPPFTATIRVVSIEVEGAHQPTFADASAVFDVRYDITEDFLFVWRRKDDLVLAAFPIREHRETRCQPATNGSRDLDPRPGGVAWYERPWFGVEWQMNLAADGFRFDSAAGAGHPEAVVYEPLLQDAPELELALEDGYFATTVRVGIGWKPIDDATAGCVFDFPTLPAGSECPSVIVALRHELRRAPP